MSESPLTLAWVDAHLKRRGMLSKYAPGPTVSTGAVSGGPLDGPCGATPRSKEFAPPVEEILAAVGHQLLSRGRHQSISLSRDGSQNTKVKDRRDPRGADSLIQSQRATPQRVASGVASFVEQQAERTGTLNGPTQACFVLHTVLTACVRHALRYSCLNSYSDIAPFDFPAYSSAAMANAVTAAEGTIMSKCGAVRDMVASSSQINFPWSARVASEHLLEVMQDAAAQKGLRSLLWKVVDKEHKGILRNVVTLCSNASSPLSDVGVEEAAVRRLFSISEDALAAARAFLDCLLSSFPTDSAVAAASLQCQRQLSLLSEHHFVYTTTSARLAALLSKEMSKVKLVVQEGAKARASVEGGLASPNEFARQLTLLLLEMTRVRMALVVLLQFEILLRRCAAAGRQQPPDDTAAVFLPSASPASLAQELCALATAAGSRALETRPHRRRFVTHFRLLVPPPEQRRSSDSHHVDTPYYSLKSVFAALSQAAATTAATVKPADFGGGVPPTTPSTPVSGLPATAGVSEDLVENDPVMRAVMSSVPLKTGEPAGRHGSTPPHTSLRPSSATGTRAPFAQTTNQRWERAREELSTQALEQQTDLTWHFRCCGEKLGVTFNAINAPPCGETDVKVQLLRPSIHVPWPFLLEVASADMRLHDGVTTTPLRPSASETSAASLTTATVRMRYNSVWSTAASMLTPLDTQHAACLQRLLAHRHNRLLTLNGCPAEKLKSVMRIAAQSVRLVVRFR
ncbi:hypothetical protein TraAM80_06225 [Trypanosoma rangeli]|uniref:Uncharacterized protein n=1 Tax=Trypanosoma rangeli TaxID=5698 RepID=A0A3R7RHI1_TRYRA|nr:uncharacterized protein TraAM80_06225 [Trypanosoma rangeli]RNF02774.1 hypothetical protein TraAM80_06225 [Trypanosoma rangeli]|eukprot:RNF02774.1 hypothetical protein TraAM80_06225 [Trypanosoma rangeli]